MRVGRLFSLCGLSVCTVFSFNLCPSSSMSERRREFLRPNIEAKGGSITLDPSSATHCVVGVEWSSARYDEIRSRRNLSASCKIVGESFLIAGEEVPPQLIHSQSRSVARPVNVQRERSPALSSSTGKGDGFVLHAALHYQEVVDKLAEGDEVDFRPNAQNMYDPNAIEVRSCHGLLGCVPTREHGSVSGKTRANVKLPSSLMPSLLGFRYAL